jgi:glucose/arabinose dehydrogenase
MDATSMICPRTCYRSALLCSMLLPGACGVGSEDGTVSVAPVLGVQRVFPALSFVSPVALLQAPGDSSRWFVVEQAGIVRAFDNTPAASATTPFVDIHTQVTSGGETGLLGMAFHPHFPADPRVFLSYTTGNLVSRISEFSSTDGGATLDPGSERVLISVNQPESNHNGGNLAFGPDGFLYIGMGDGGSGGDPFNNAQDNNSLLGKILRIDVESAPDPGLAYAIPTTNPFVQTAGFRGEIWALGLRNPWRFSFDRLTGDLYIGDVGQGSFEEVDFQAAGSAGGQNYGWRIMEGAHCFDPAICSQAGLVLPVAEYDHGQGCSITGGFVYRGQAFPALQGFYLYADFCTGRFWGLKRDGSAWQNSILLVEPHSISSFGEDEAGNLYAADLAAGVVYEIVVP